MASRAHCLGRVADVAELVDMKPMFAGSKSAYIRGDFHSSIGRGEDDDPGSLISSRRMNDGDGCGHGGGCRRGQTERGTKEKKHGQRECPGERRGYFHTLATWF